MPLEIDESWEYWEPDPEVAEAMCRTAEGFAVLGIEERRTGTAHGFRFGRGNPNFTRFSLKRAKPQREREPERARCRTCGREFEKRFGAQVLCSKQCNPGRERTILPRRCELCDTVFRPMEDAQRFCSKRCGAANASASPDSCVRRMIDPVEFREMWLRGDGVEAIAAHFGVRRSAVYKERRRQRLQFCAARSPGVDPVAFTEMWRRGDRALDIAARFGIGRRDVTRQCARLGLEPRGPGGRR